MPRSLHSRESVLGAVREHDRLGRDVFLRKYGFGPATHYKVRVGGRLYDSKAIVGVAFGIENPESGPLTSKDFNGGVSTEGAAWQLQRLGFEIVTIATPHSSPGRR